MGRQVRSGNCVQVALPLWRNNPEQGLSLIHRRERCTSQHSWLHANVHVRPAVRARWWCVSTHLTPVNVSIPDPCPPTRPLKRACAFNHAGNRDVRNIASPIKRNYPRLEKDRTKKAISRGTSNSNEGNSGSDKSSGDLQPPGALRETNITTFFPSLCLSLKRVLEGNQRSLDGVAIESHSEWKKRTAIDVIIVYQFTGIATFYFPNEHLYARAVIATTFHGARRWITS